LRDTTAADGLASPEQREAQLLKQSLNSNKLRADSWSGALGDRSANEAVFSMRLAENSPNTSKALPDFELVSNSEDQVGIGASLMAKSGTSMTNREWGGLIYKTEDGQYHATPPITVNERGAVPTDQAASNVPVWAQNGIIADYHSHTIPETQAHTVIDTPSVIFDPEHGWGTMDEHSKARAVLPENPNGNRFSSDDTFSAYQNQQTGYMADTLGHVHKYKPAPKPHPDFEVDTDKAGATSTLI